MVRAGRKICEKKTREKSISGRGASIYRAARHTHTHTDIDRERKNGRIIVTKHVGERKWRKYCEIENDNTHKRKERYG